MPEEELSLDFCPESDPGCRAPEPKRESVYVDPRVEKQRAIDRVIEESDDSDTILKLKKKVHRFDEDVNDFVISKEAEEAAKASGQRGRRADDEEQEETPEQIAKRKRRERMKEQEDLKQRQKALETEEFFKKQERDKVAAEMQQKQALTMDKLHQQQNDANLQIMQAAEAGVKAQHAQEVALAAQKHADEIAQSVLDEYHENAGVTSALEEWHKRRRTRKRTLDDV